MKENDFSTSATKSNVCSADRESHSYSSNTPTKAAPAILLLIDQ